MQVLRVVDMKKDQINTAVADHLAQLGVPLDCWTWTKRTAELTMTINARMHKVKIMAGKTTQREMAFHLGRITGWWEARA
jgi:hypothetical protein